MVSLAFYFETLENIGFPYVFNDFKKKNLIFSSKTNEGRSIALL